MSCGMRNTICSLVSKSILSQRICFWIKTAGDSCDGQTNMLGVGDQGNHEVPPPTFTICMKL